MVESVISSSFSNGGGYLWWLVVNVGNWDKITGVFYGDCVFVCLFPPFPLIKIVFQIVPFENHKKKNNELQKWNTKLIFSQTLSHISNDEFALWNTTIGEKWKCESATEIILKSEVMLHLKLFKFLEKN